MTTMQIDRAVVEQALDSINELFAAEQSEGGERGGHIRTPATREHLVRVAQARKALHESCGALRAALAQQAEPTGKQPLQVESVAAVAENATTQQQIEQTPPSDYRRGYWAGFAIGKREGRIEAEDALAQQAEPVGQLAELQAMLRVEVDRLIAAGIQPQRKPLTEEEIEACRQQGCAHAGFSAPFDFGKAARAVERAHGIKE